MQARTYLPAYGKFAQVDPEYDQTKDDPESWNLYSYVTNNPVTHTDPDGREGVPWYLGGNSPVVDRVLNVLQTITVTANPGYQMLAQPADLLASAINAGANQNIPMASNMGKAAEGGSGTTDLLVYHSLEVPLGIVEGELGGKAIEGVAGAMGRAEAKLLGETATAETTAGKTYQTYTKTNPSTGEVYSGRTSGTGTPAENVARRDTSHHMNKKGFGPSRLDKSSTSKAAIRGREQLLIDANGGAKSSGGTSGNAINGISPANPSKSTYIDAAKKEF